MSAVEVMAERVEPRRTETASVPRVEHEFAAIYQEHSRAIYYLALRFLGNPESAEDVVHDVFLKAFRKWGEFRGESCVRTWLYRIAINHCQNVVRSWHHRHIQSMEPDPSWEQNAESHDNPLQVLETKELGQRIQRTLDTLPEEYRLLLLLVADQQMSYDEIAQLTGQSADAVRGKLHRARKAFAAYFPKTS
jgi:RNA polymerase sigma-70 factor, ECF subfamily